MSDKSILCSDRSVSTKFTNSRKGSAIAAQSDAAKHFSSVCVSADLFTIGLHNRRDAGVQIAQVASRQSFEISKGFCMPVPRVTYTL